jgi:hypothetical protein
MIVLAKSQQHIAIKTGYYAKYLKMETLQNLLPVQAHKLADDNILGFWLKMIMIL